MNYKELIQDTENWLSPIKHAQDPQTKLIRRLLEALKELTNVAPSVKT